MEAMSPVDAAIAAAYRAAAEPALWPQALLHVGEAMRGDFTLIGTVDSVHSRTSSITSRPFRPGNKESYRATFFHINPRSTYAAKAPVGEPFYDAKLGERRALERHPYYGEFLNPTGYAYFISANLRQGTAGRVNLSVQRETRAGHIERAELRDFRRLVPHMVAAFELGERIGGLETERRLLGDALEALGEAAIVLKEDGAVLAANALGGEALAAHGPLAAEDGALRTRGVAGRRALVSTLARVASFGGRARCELKDGGGARWSLTVAPLPDRERGLSQRRLLLRLKRIERLNSVEDLARTLGLTAAEAALALALADGQRPPDYARAHGVSINTVRSHLAALRAKLEARTQAAIVRRVLESLR